MMNFKNHKSGFFLIEAVMALFIAGLMLGALFNGIGGLLQHISRGKAQFERLIFAKDFLLSTIVSNAFAEEPVTSAEKKIDDPEVTLKFTQDAIAKESSLGKLAALRNTKVQYKYSWLANSITDNLVYFQYQKFESSKEAKA